jgi:deazaflavin-dependent oxidoreductase (nitroreductase family)
MATQLTALHPERGWLRVALRLPVLLYHAHLGWLLGERFLLLTHIGRRSGLPRQTVLEVVAHDRASDTYVVVSALGERAQWFRNIQQTPEVGVTVGRRQLEATAVRLPEDEAEQVIRAYIRRHPIAFRALAGLLVGWRVRGTAADVRRFAHAFPLVALRPGRRTA